MKHSFTLNTLPATQKLAKSIARIITPGFIVSLNGNLGAGKTTLVRNILQSMGITDNVKSPTFTLVEPYKINELNVFHFDLYRFTEPEEWFELGFDEYFTPNSICFIEWADRATGLIPNIDWAINLTMQGDIHYCQIIANTGKGYSCLQALMVEWVNE
jgi:tRNA threonylcarbamoyladenosine biosynthesis protein TsaE